MRLRGGTPLHRLRSMNASGEDQHLPHQRRDVTYVSRLQAVQAAVDHQLNEMAKNSPFRRVGVVTFNCDVSVENILACPVPCSYKKVISTIIRICYFSIRMCYTILW